MLVWLFVKKRRAKRDDDKGRRILASRMGLLVLAEVERKERCYCLESRRAQDEAVQRVARTQGTTKALSTTQCPFLALCRTHDARHDARAAGTAAFATVGLRNDGEKEGKQWGVGVHGERAAAAAALWGKRRGAGVKCHGKKRGSTHCSNPAMERASVKPCRAPARARRLQRPGGNFCRGKTLGKLEIEGNREGVGFQPLGCRAPS